MKGPVASSRAPHGVTVPKHWPKTLKEEWKVTVGEGYSSPALVGSSVFVFSREKDAEVVRCLDVADGKEIWRSEPCPAPCKPGPAAPGDIKTRATPTVAGGRVFTLGVNEILSCFDARTGKELWTVKIDAPGEATPITYMGRDGRQYVVIASGSAGHLRSVGNDGDDIDSLTAFALAQ